MGIENSGREGHRTPTSSTEVKNGGAILPLPHCVFMVSYLINPLRTKFLLNNI
jgi:hypothetical protein